MEQIKQLPWQKLIPVRPIFSGITVGCWLGSRNREWKELPMAIWFPAVYVGYGLAYTAAWESDNNYITAHWKLPVKPKEKEVEAKVTPPSP